MFNAITSKIRHAFSQAADQYDVLTSLHKEIGRELVKKNVKREAGRILDVGCGTGYVANKAKYFFPESHVMGMDSAEGMIQKCVQEFEGVSINWVLADAQYLPFAQETFDLILSNLAYQWVVDMPLALAEACRVLNNGGVFHITLFGQRTCQELFSSLDAVVPNCRMQQLPTSAQMKSWMQQLAFKESIVEEELIKVSFRDVYELLGWLKAIGANQLGTKMTFMGKEAWDRVNAYYKSHYPYADGICVSFEVIWVYGKK